MVLLALLVCSTARTYQATPFHPGALPDIYGDETFQGNVQQALDYLQASYPDDYHNVTFWLSEIRPTDTYTRVDSYGVCHIDVTDQQASYYWLASVLIHEAQHVADDHVYFVDHAYTADQSEYRALVAQASYLAAINDWTSEQKYYWVNGWMSKKYWETIPAEYGEA